MEELVLIVLVALASSYVMFSRTRDVLAFHLRKLRFARKTTNLFDEESVEHDDAYEQKQSELDFNAIQKSSATVYSSLSKIREFVVRDFISYWYNPFVSKHSCFPDQVRITVDYAFCSLAEKGLQVDWASFFMKETVVYLTDQIRYFRFSEEQVMKRYKRYGELSTEQRKVLLLGEIFRNYQLHEGGSNPEQFLRKLSSKIVKNILRTSDYQCEAVRSLLVEVFTCNILSPIMEFVSPYWINYAIVQLTSKHDDAMDMTKGVLDEKELEDIDLSEDDLEELEHQMLHEPLTPTNTAVRSSTASRDSADTVNSRSLFASSPGSIGADPPVSSYQVSVTGWTYAYDHSHKPYVLYKLDVRSRVERWALWKRYSNFTDLHQKLTKTVPTFKAKLPKKKFLDLFENMDKKFIKQRALDLNHYLNHGIQFNTQCTETEEWKEFVKPRGNRKKVRKGSKETDATSGGRSLQNPLKLKNYGPDLTKPLYDLIGEIFELEKRGWVQRQVGWIVTAALQSFDRNLSRRYTAKFSELTHEDNIAAIIDGITGLVWPNGELFTAAPPITDQEIAQCEIDARKALSDLLPSSITTLLGSEFCESRLVKLHTFLQLEPVVKHLAYTIIEKVFTKMLQKKDKKSSRRKKQQ